MTETIDWNEMESSPYVKWENIGDKVSGVVTAVRPGRDFNGNPCPVLDLMTQDGPKILSCGQADLKAKIVAVKPASGDTITVTYSSTEKVEKGLKKVFTVDHNMKAPY